MAVHTAGGDLLAGAFHHAPRLLVERALPLGLALQGGVHGVSKRARRLFREKLAARQAARCPSRDEILLGIGEAHASYRADVITLRAVDWDETGIARWLEPLAVRPGEMAEVFGETLSEVAVEWNDGQVRDSSVRREEGTSARWRHGGQEQFVFVPGTGEASVREAVRALRLSAGREALPIRPARALDHGAEEPTADAERSARRMAGILSRHAPRHRVRWRVRETRRRVIGSGRPSSSVTRRLLSLEGRFVAASRPGDEERSIAFHAPDADATWDELKSFFSAAAAPRDRAAPVSAGETDVVLAEGSAALLFHEILGHPLEADAGASPLSLLGDARVAPSELEVHDDARRLDLFGGYERDDEGTAPRLTRLIHSGRVGSRLTDRAHGGASGSTGHGRRAGASEPPRPRGSNIVVLPGSASPDELVRRLNNGIWIEELSRGSVELSNGTFRLRFPRARRVRRGRLADELGPGELAGEILPTLKNIEPVLGRESRACRGFGWCARGGQLVPVQGAAPDLLIRRLAARPAP